MNFQAPRTPLQYKFSISSPKFVGVWSLPLNLLMELKVVCSSGRSLREGHNTRHLPSRSNSSRVSSLWTDRQTGLIKTSVVYIA
jgi:hypothetical protein